MNGNTIAIDALIMDRNKAGIGNYAFHIIKALQEAHCDLLIDVYMQQHMIQYFKSSPNMNFIPCPDFMSSRKRILYQQIQMPKLYNSKKYSLVHFLDYMVPLFGVKAKKVVTIHDLSYFIYPEFFTAGSRLIKQLLTGPGIKRADRVICVSENTKKDVQRLFGAGNKLRVTHLGVEQYGLSSVNNPDNGTNHRVLDKYGINGNFILYAGTLEPRKNVEALIRAYKTAVSEHRISHKLVLCGKPGWKYEGIYSQIKDSGLSDNIILTGYVPEDELSCIFKAADAFVYPSLYEGFGLPPLEAMAHGVPIICSDVSSMPEVVGDAALTFPPGDVEMLSRHIIRLLGDDNLRSGLIEKGRCRASMFTWKKTAVDTLKVYNELLM